MIRWVWRITVGVVAVGVIVAVGLVLWPSKPPIPGPIKSQLTTTLYVPLGGGYTVDRASARYDSSLKLLTYRVLLPGGASAVVSEQPSPSSFVDIPGYYDGFVKSLGPVSQFATSLGTVQIVNGKTGASGQAAVLYAGGTLTFVNPSVPLPADQWRRLFRAMTVVH